MKVGLEMGVRAVGVAMGRGWFDQLRAGRERGITVQRRGKLALGGDMPTGGEAVDRSTG